MLIHVVNDVYMQLKKINSRSLSAIGYDPASLLLEVKFKISGRIYAYLEVQKDIYNKFISSRSKGQFFNKFIKSNYKYFLIK